MILASSLKDHQVVFECYNPSLRLGTPHMICSPVSTRASTARSDADLTLIQLRIQYTILKPKRTKKESNSPRQHPAGGTFLPPTNNPIPASFAASANTLSSSGTVLKQPEEEMVTQLVHLESHELFTQLCANVKLIKCGPREGVYRSCVPVGQGTLRVWRDWLSEHAAIDDSNNERMFSKDNILWIDTQKNIGLRMRVRRVSDYTENINPLLERSSGEDEDVQYVVGYEGMLVTTFIQFLRLLLRECPLTSHHDRAYHSLFRTSVKDGRIGSSREKEFR